MDLTCIAAEGIEDASERPWAEIAADILLQARIMLKAFVAFLGTLTFAVAGNNAVALVLWLVFKFAWWPLLAPSCFYTSNGLPAPPPQDYLINLIVFVPLTWFAWVFSRKRSSQ
jgi:hypothetical protein